MNLSLKQNDKVQEGMGSYIVNEGTVTVSLKSAELTLFTDTVLDAEDS